MLNMSTVEEAEKLLSRMTPGEKAQLLQRVAQESRDAYPGIDTIDGVCGGEPVIVRTRVPVWPGLCWFGESDGPAGQGVSVLLLFS